MSVKKFSLRDTFSGEDVLGGEVGLDNVFVSLYGSVLKDHKLPKDLEVGETSLLEYRMSGQKPKTYRLVRTS